MTFTDDEIEDEIRMTVEDEDDLMEQDILHELEEEGLDLEDVEASEFAEEFSFFEVTCRRGCGTFSIDDVSVLHLDVSRGTAEWRCPNCNDIQAGSLLIIDY